MSSSGKSKRRSNPIARALPTPPFRLRTIRPKKGRGSYSLVSRRLRVVDSLGTKKKATLAR